MEYEDLTRLARWVIPGWVTIALLSTFVAIDVSFSPPNGCLDRYLKAIKLLTIQDILVVTALFAALSVPFGFVIYQLYFYMRWNSPFSRDGSGLVFNSPGRMKESLYILADLDKDKITTRHKNQKHSNNKTWRNKWVGDILFSLNHKFRWQYIELLFFDVLFQSREGESWIKRYRYRQEILHTLGATSVATIVAFLVYIIAKIAVANDNAHGAGYLLFSLVVYFVIIWTLNRENVVFRDMYATGTLSNKDERESNRINLCEVFDMRICQDNVDDQDNSQTRESNLPIKIVMKKIIKSVTCIECPCFVTDEFHHGHETDSSTSQKCNFPTSFIRIGPFFVFYPTYMIITWAIVIFAFGSGVFVKDASPTLRWLILIIFSIPLLLWIAIHRKYKPSIVPNVIWFISIISASIFIIYNKTCYSYLLGTRFMFNTFSPFGPVLQEIFTDNGFLLNMIIFSAISAILSSNRSTARLEVISLVRYTLNKFLMEQEEAW